MFNKFYFLINIFFRGCGIGGLGSLEIGKTIVNHLSLKKFDIENNEISDRGLDLLFISLSQKKNSIEEVNIGNKKIKNK